MWFFGTHPSGWAESGRNVLTVGTEVPILRNVWLFGTHPSGWAESGRNVLAVGTEVPIPICSSESVLLMLKYGLDLFRVS